MAKPPRARWLVPAPDQLTGRLGSASAERLDPEVVRVLVWNVFKGRRRSFGARFGELANASDLILAQELVFGADIEVQFDKLALEWTTATSFQYARRDNLATGLGTAARAPALRADALQTDGREPVTRTPKLALMTEHHIGEHRLLVANVHAINFAGYAHFDAQLARVEERLATHEGPLLLAGDFNTWSRRRHRRLEKLCSSTGLDAVEFEDDRRTNVLDHAFVRELEVGEARVEDSRASDHAALRFELSAPASKADPEPNP